MIQDNFLQLKAIAEDTAKRKAKAEGSYEQLQKEGKKQYGVKEVEEAEALLKQGNKAYSKAVKEYEKEKARIESEYADLIEARK